MSTLTTVLLLKVIVLAPCPAVFCGISTSRSALPEALESRRRSVPPAGMVVAGMGMEMVQTWFVPDTEHVLTAPVGVMAVASLSNVAESVRAGPPPLAVVIRRTVTVCAGSCNDLPVGMTDVRTQVWFESPPIDAPVVLVTCGVRVSCRLSYRYSTLLPVAGPWDADTVVFTDGVAPVPLAFVIVALLVITSPDAAVPPIVTSNTIVAEPPAGTVIPVTLTWPVPLAPPEPTDWLVEPAGVLTTDKLPTFNGRSSTTCTPVAATPCPPVSFSVMV